MGLTSAFFLNQESADSKDMMEVFPGETLLRRNARRKMVDQEVKKDMRKFAEANRPTEGNERQIEQRTNHYRLGHLMNILFNSLKPFARFVRDFDLKEKALLEESKEAEKLIK